MRALCRGLDGTGPLPFEYWIGRLCEEFHCLPSEAFREWLTVPADFLEHVIEARHFAKAKATFDAAEKPSDLPKSEAIDLVKMIELEVKREDLAAREAHR